MSSQCRSSLLGAAGALDLLFGVAEGAEYPVVEPDPARLLEKMGADIFPHRLALRRHLEEAAVAALTYQRVAVRETLRAGNIGAEEFEDRLVGVAPHDLARAWIDLDNARERHRIVVPVRAVVEDQNVAVRQGAGIVLLRQWRTADLPDDVAARALDHDDGRDIAKADEDVAVGGLRDRVGMRPFVPHVLRRHRIALRLHVLPAAPLPDNLARGRHFEQIVGVDDAIRLGAGQPAFYPPRNRLG